MDAIAVEAVETAVAPPATETVSDTSLKVTVGDMPAFVAALGLVKQGVSTRSTLPIIGHIRLDAAKGRVRLTATNLSYGVTVDVPATVEVEGATTVPAKLFADFVGTLSKDQPLSLEHSLRSKQVTVVSGRDKARIKTIDADQFPSVEVMEDVTGAVELPCGETARAIRRTVMSASADDSRPLLTYARVRFLDDKKAEWAAVDGFRSSLVTMTVDHNVRGDDATWLVPASALAVVVEMIKDAPADEPLYGKVVRPRTGRPHAILRRGLRQMDVELGEGNFPAVDQIIPKTWSTRISVDRSLLSGAVRRASLLSKDGAGAVKLEANSVEQVLLVSGKSTSAGDSLARIAIVMDGPSVAVGFAARYIEDAIDAIQGDVVFETAGATSPGVFRQRGDDSFVHVVMPMVL